MRLTYYTDYSLRVLIYLTLKENNSLTNIKEISEAYNISRNHLTKIIHELGKLGYIETIRGRNGGIRLKRFPKDINVGELVRRTEEDFYLLECFEGDNHACVLSPICKLKMILNEAMNAFFEVLDEYTLEDITINKKELLLMLGLESK